MPLEPPKLVSQGVAGDALVLFIPGRPILPLITAAPAGQDENAQVVREVDNGLSNYNRTSLINNKFEQQYTGKVEHKFSDTVSLTGFYLYNRTDEPCANYFSDRGSSTADQTFANRFAAYGLLGRGQRTLLLVELLFFRRELAAENFLMLALLLQLEQELAIKRQSDFQIFTSP